MSDGETYWVNYQSDENGYRPTVGKGLGGIRPGEVSHDVEFNFDDNLQDAKPPRVGKFPITHFALPQDANIDPNLLKSLVG